MRALEAAVAEARLRGRHRYRHAELVVDAAVDNVRRPACSSPFCFFESSVNERPQLITSLPEASTEMQKFIPFSTVVKLYLRTSEHLGKNNDSALHASRSTPSDDQ